jgi:hypothetical protein
MFSWHDVSKNLPLIATVVAKNNQPSIFECLESACQACDGVLVLLDKSSDHTAQEIDKFLRRNRPKNVHIFDTSRTDPWPNIKTESYGKNLAKAFQLVMNLAPNSIWFFLEPTTILFEKSSQIIRESVSSWSQPQLGCNFYSSIVGEKKSISSFSLWTQGLIKPGIDSSKGRYRLYTQKDQEVFLISQPDDQNLVPVGSEIIV